MYLQLCIPRIQMTLVLLEKGYVLEGWPSKIEVIWALGIYTFIDTVLTTH